jgi:hypothetical protein
VQMRPGQRGECMDAGRDRHRRVADVRAEPDVRPRGPGQGSALRSLDSGRGKRRRHHPPRRGGSGRGPARAMARRRAQGTRGAAAGGVHGRRRDRGPRRRRRAGRPAVRGRPPGAGAAVRRGGTRRPRIRVHPARDRDGPTVAGRRRRGLDAECADEQPLLVGRRRDRLRRGPRGPARSALGQRAPALARRGRPATASRSCRHGGSASMSTTRSTSS